MEKFLIVEDVPELRSMIKMCLSYGKYQFLEADDGGSAIDIALKENPQVILLDIRLSDDVDGFAVCRRLRESGLTESYIVMLSGTVQLSDIEKGYTSGANYYLPKPFSPSSLIQIVEGLRFGKLLPEEVDTLGHGVCLRIGDHSFSHIPTTSD